MRVHIRALAVSAGLSLAVGATAVSAPAGATTSTPRSSPRGALIGTVHVARAHSITVRRAMHRDWTALRAAGRGALGRDGKLAGNSLPVRASGPGRAWPGSRPAARTGGANSGHPASAAAYMRVKHWTLASPARHEITAGRVTPAISPGDFTGITEGNSFCSGCQTPDPTGTVNATQIAETTNLSLQVYSKSTAATLCTVSLSSLLGATTALARPRIQYDNASHRFSLVVDSVPSSPYDIAIQYLAASQTDNACGAWWVYSLSFPISSTYPLGATLDYPYLGQDSVSLLSSTNNYNANGSYVGSSAYAIPKAAAYSGGGFSFNTYSVAFSTAPVTVAGIPIFSTSTTYWIAAVPGTGYDLYQMPTNPAGAITLKFVVRAPFNAPSRRVHQPYTSRTLDPLDGRIPSAAVQDGNFVWFAHTVDDQGFPTVLYGAINTGNGQIDEGLAYHSSTSDDFNAAIGVTDAGSNTNFIWVSWAYTDTYNGVPVSATVAGVAPGQGVPDLTGVDLTLVTGSSTGSISTFGGYSSTQVDSFANGSCPAGETALTTQEYFTSSGSWATQLAKTTFC